jgi:DNA-directed RNA polymerase specialized sigma24 family protein
MCLLSEKSEPLKFEAILNARELPSSGPNRAGTRRVNDHAAPDDLCAIFHDQLDHLYTLALLLTADQHEAEQCFMRGLEDCVAGKPAFREWARSWTRRAIIKNAIRMLSPAPERSRQPAAAKARKPPEQAFDNRSRVGAITQLEPFDRFVYVMSVLEGYSTRDCSTLLGCTEGEVVNARSRALFEIANVAANR